MYTEYIVPSFVLIPKPVTPISPHQVLGLARGVWLRRGAAQAELGWSFQVPVPLLEDVSLDLKAMK